MVRDDLSTVLRTATGAAAGRRADAPCRRRRRRDPKTEVSAPTWNSFPTMRRPQGHNIHFIWFYKHSSRYIRTQNPEVSCDFRRSSLEERVASTPLQGGTFCINVGFTVCDPKETTAGFSSQTSLDWTLTPVCQCDWCHWCDERKMLTSVVVSGRHQRAARWNCCHPAVVAVRCARWRPARQNKQSNQVLYCGVFSCHQHHAPFVLSELVCISSCVKSTSLPLFFCLLKSPLRKKLNIV